MELTKTPRCYSRFSPRIGERAVRPAQDTQGPMAPPPKFEVKRISADPHPGPPPVPQEEIIKRFAANEVVMQKQYDAYNFTQMIRVEELTDPGGKFTVTGEVYTRPTANASARHQATESTLRLPICTRRRENNRHSASLCSDADEFRTMF